MQALILFSMIGIASCASTPYRDNDLCSEITSFANTTKIGDEHSVSLTAIWGPTTEHPDQMSYKHCEHGNYAPGAKLCKYLMSNTSTEFPAINFRRALACINGKRDALAEDIAIDRIDTLIWRYEPPGAHPGISIGIEFLAVENRTPTLKLIAKAHQP